MSKVLERKLRRVLELSTDSPSLVVALDAISPFFEADSVQAGRSSSLDVRKSLRQDLEKQNYNLSLCFLKSFERLKGRLESLEQEVDQPQLKSNFKLSAMTLLRGARQVDGLEDGCRSASARLSSAESSMRQFTDRAQALRHRRAELSRRARQVERFLHTFQLTPEEAALVGAAGGLEEPAAARAFFAALARLRAAHARCTALVGSQSAGFELLDALSRHLEGAYERLYHWVQARRVKCQEQLSDEETPQADGTLQVAVRALRARPAYYSHCQESIVSMRRRLVAQRFVAELAQARGAADGRAMEGIDCVRYTADVLAWVHQTAAAERELLAALFGSGGDAAHNGARRLGGGSGSSGGAEPADADGVDGAAEAGGADADAGSAGLVTVPAALSGVMSAVARPLRARLGTVLEDVRDAVTAYRLLGFLAFYGETVGQLVDSREGLGLALTEARADGLTRFRALLSAPAQRLAATTHAPADLSPLGATLEAARRAQELVRAAATLPAATAPECALAPPLAAALEPPLDACARIARGMDASDAVSEPRRRACAQVLERCGLGRVLRAAATAAAAAHDGGATAAAAPLAEQPGLEAHTVASAMAAFYSALFSLTMPELERVRAPLVKGRARQLSSRQIADAHAHLHGVLSAPAAGYRDAASFLSHTPDQVRIILDCDD
ncbi:oligomeric complex COG6-domain-containing protein [Tribonema minus]|uniref:Conserved oligomeric Golgi complex subunit 6 n=1 Tax=Tribonema minus TaxID=303371 RepID=A0A836CBI3_9STRA|nr:oligomeric complex COG6-domain-containing protein [Tribonema minus]